MWTRGKGPEGIAFRWSNFQKLIYPLLIHKMYKLEAWNEFLHSVINKNLSHFLPCPYETVNIIKITCAKWNNAICFASARTIWLIVITL